MQAGRVPGKRGILASMPAEHILVFRPAFESGLKPSLATTIAKASERVIADPPARKTRGRATGDVLFPVLRKKRIDAEFGYDDRKGVGACDRRPSG
jgi:hypothetical protein